MLLLLVRCDVWRNVFRPVGVVYHGSPCTLLHFKLYSRHFHHKGVNALRMRIMIRNVLELLSIVLTQESWYSEFSSPNKRVSYAAVSELSRPLTQSGKCF